VLSYCLSLPERILFDSRTKMDRMLIRAAMKGQLPDDVRLNRKRGLQAADLPFRLRADRDAMEACLDDLQHGPATDYLNMKRLRHSWSVVLERDDEDAYREASVVLLRAIMVGLFVNEPAAVQRPLAAPAIQDIPASVS
jgi:asparagine synthase (glutamine-hydrolysing)